MEQSTKSLGNALVPGFQRPSPPPFPEKKSNLEDLITKFIQTSEQCQQATDAALRNHEASIHNLETQVGQIAKLLSERPQGSLPGNTEPNPKEQVKAVTLRSGKEMQSGKGGEPVTTKASEGDSTKERVAERSEENPQEDGVMKEQGQKRTLQVQPYKPQLPYPARLKKERD